MLGNGCAGARSSPCVASNLVLSLRRARSCSLSVVLTATFLVGEGNSFPYALDPLIPDSLLSCHIPSFSPPSHSLILPPPSFPYPPAHLSYPRRLRRRSGPPSCRGPRTRTRRPSAGSSRWSPATAAAGAALARSPPPSPPPNLSLVLFCILPPSVSLFLLYIESLSSPVDLSRWSLAPAAAGAAHERTHARTRRV